MSFIKSMKNKECNSAIKRVFKNIDITKINNFINSVEFITENRKEFYKNIINQRYNIIKEVYNKIK